MLVCKFWPLFRSLKFHNFVTVAYYCTNFLTLLNDHRTLNVKHLKINATFGKLQSVKTCEHGELAERVTVKPLLLPNMVTDSLTSAYSVEHNINETVCTSSTNPVTATR